MPFCLTRSDTSKCAGEMIRRGGEERPGQHLLRVCWCLMPCTKEVLSPAAHHRGRHPARLSSGLKTHPLLLANEGGMEALRGPVGEKDWTDPHRCVKIRKGSCRTEWRQAPVHSIARVRHNLATNNKANLNWGWRVILKGVPGLGINWSRIWRCLITKLQDAASTCSHISQQVNAYSLHCGQNRSKKKKKEDHEIDSLLYQLAPPQPWCPAHDLRVLHNTIRKKH